eukprot:GILJ01018996.1.p1 GENE.GILJ01018996.1~~GILJ01018996.1.p1  ORF type:complete len:297 (-),score=18.57 GILJ01018996.1:275-1165(-)
MASSCQFSVCKNRKSKSQVKKLRCGHNVHDRCLEKANLYREIYSCVVCEEPVVDCICMRANFDFESDGPRVHFMASKMFGRSPLTSTTTTVASLLSKRHEYNNGFVHWIHNVGLCQEYCDWVNMMKGKMGVIPTAEFVQHEKEYNEKVQQGIERKAHAERIMKDIIVPLMNDSTKSNVDQMLPPTPSPLPTPSSQQPPSPAYPTPHRPTSMIYLGEGILASRQSVEALIHQYNGMAPPCLVPVDVAREAKSYRAMLRLSDDRMYWMCYLVKSPDEPMILTFALPLFSLYYFLSAQM